MPVDMILSCDHLVKVYDTPTGRVQAVRGVDLELEVGQLTAVVGPSGSGKSSLLRMLAGLDTPTAGRVTLAGTELFALSSRRRSQARAKLLTHVYQRPTENLLPHLTAAQQLWRVGRPRSAVAVDDALSRVQLSHRRDHLPNQMSGGERQRLAFARAVVAGHRLVLADEPTSLLDGAATLAIASVMAELSALGVTVLVATHDRRLIEHVDQVVTLRDGAVASVTSGGHELAVIDRSGRLQLPPEIRARFPGRRARLYWDEEDGGRVIVEQP